MFHEKIQIELNYIIVKLGFFNGPNQIISLSEKIFFRLFCLHKISKLGPDSNIEKNSKHWRQYMQNFLRTPFVREFYRNADSNRHNLEH